MKSIRGTRLRPPSQFPARRACPARGPVGGAGTRSETRGEWRARRAGVLPLPPRFPASLRRLPRGGAHAPGLPGGGARAGLWGLRVRPQGPRRWDAAVGGVWRGGRPRWGPPRRGERAGLRVGSELGQFYVLRMRPSSQHTLLPPPCASSGLLPAASVCSRSFGLDSRAAPPSGPHHPAETARPQATGDLW